jgi:hypothetical protein
MHRSTDNLGKAIRLNMSSLAMFQKLQEDFNHEEDSQRKMFQCADNFD